MTFSNTFFLEVIFHTRKEKQSHHKPLVCHSSKKASSKFGVWETWLPARSQWQAGPSTPETKLQGYNSALTRCLSTAHAWPCQTNSGNLIPRGRWAEHLSFTVPRPFWILFPGHLVDILAQAISLDLRQYSKSHQFSTQVSNSYTCHKMRGKQACL